MLLDYQLGQTSVVLRVKLRQDSTGASPGKGKTGVAFNTTGLVVSTIADNEATATAYTAAGSTVESITTLGTYAAPTATKCRFKEVDATNHPGVYELQLADARLGVASAKSLLVSITGVSGVMDTDCVIPLRSVNPYDGVRFGVTALPNAAAGANGGLPTVDANNNIHGVQPGTGTGQINPSGGKVPATLASTDVTGNVAADLQTIKTQTVTCSGGVTVSPFVGSTGAAVNGTAANALSGHDPGGTLASAANQTTINNNVLAAPAAVWDVTLASHLTSGTTGAALNAAGSAGDPWATTLPGAYGAGTAGYIVGNNLDAAVSSRLAPTVAGRTLDVSATGEAGIDWANVGSPTTAVDLSGTTISTSQAVTSVSGSVGSVATGGITAASFDVGTGLVPVRTTHTAQAGGSSTITLDASSSPTDNLFRGLYVYLVGGTGSGQVRLITAYNGTTKVATVAPNWVTNPDATTTFVIQGLVGGAVDVEQWLGATAPANTGDAFARLGAPAGASVSADVAAVKSDTAAVVAKLPTNAIADETLVIAATNSILAAVGSPMQAGAAVTLATSQPNYAPAKAGDAMTLTSAYDFAKGTVAMTESYPASGAVPTPAEGLLTILQYLTNFAISGTTYQVKKVDKTTNAFAVTLNDATSPTGASR